jgi:hypothetical protein
MRNIALYIYLVDYLVAAARIELLSNVLSSVHAGHDAIIETRTAVE